MTSLESSLLKSKFRACLLGSLIGDCTGAPYEGCSIICNEKNMMVQRYFDELEDLNFKSPFKPYTDDTAMMKSVAKFLIDKPKPDYKFLAELFVTEFFNEPKRRYGLNVVEVFNKLKNSKFEDVFKPASEQFSGSGSYGNGGAMRVAPIALYFYNDYNTMLEVARNATKITHTNILGINGALLQCIAVNQALLSDPKTKINPKRFCTQLCDKMKEIEKEEQDDSHGVSKAYQNKLKIVENLLKRKHDNELDKEVVQQLGHGISAYESVPTAIYCFLKAQNGISSIKTENTFRRTIQYAINLGGDTDTIACMAGAIAGAYLGEDSINSVLAKHCEFHEEILELADNLFRAKEGSQIK